MEKPLKKRRKSARLNRAFSLALLFMALLLGFGFFYISRLKANDIPVVPYAPKQRTLLVHRADELTGVTVALRDGTGYTLLGQAGHLTVLGRPDFVMDTDMETKLIVACTILTAEDTIMETYEEWEPYQAEFGLDPPAVTVKMTYSDGGTAAFSLGNKAPDNNNLNYYTLSGDPKLYLASADLIELFDQDVTAFHHIDQPFIHRQRIDRITIKNGSGDVTAAWELETKITDRDALSAWRMTMPYNYPCDANAMDSMLSAMEKLYLGQFVEKATDEAKEAYGFTPPKRVITLNQAAGQIASIGETGAYDLTSYPESTLTVSVGNTQSDYVEYCLVNDSVYLVSSLSQPFISNLIPEKTLLLQPMAINLDTVASLTVEKGNERNEYVLTRQEKVLRNNELAKDENGNVLYDTFVSLGGRDTDEAAFENAFSRMQSVTVLNRLPEGFYASGPPDYKLTVTFTDGRSRTIECVPFDELNNALSVDGVFLYYLPKGALDKGL